ncbi:MAG: hypothetical protein ACXACD_11740 [Candidatus Thorarchaeota archaeon]
MSLRPRKLPRINRFKPKGKSFHAYGWGTDGPYYTYGRRRGKFTAKTSVGTRGAEVAFKHTGRAKSTELRLNLTKKKLSLKRKLRKRKLKRRK